MSACRGSARFDLTACIVAAGIASFASIGTASAQDFFETIFGGLRRAIEQPEHAPNAFANPFTRFFRAFGPRLPPPQQQQTRADAVPSEGFCVRRCDGRYFRVRSYPGASAAAMCHAFCPASETRLYYGGDIDYATAPDGSRYADLGNAYLYRQQLVAGCTCNGHDAFGLAHININSDPTLKPGDVVAAKDGLMAFTGNKDKTGQFTPVQSYSGLSKSERQQLSAIKVTPSHPDAPAEAAAVVAPGHTAQTNGSGNTQLSR